MTKNILIVDDSKTIRDMLEFTLQSAGFSVHQAEDGVQAKDMLESSELKQLDLLITDLNMPNMDGFGLIEYVRKDSPHNYIPILMLTTESDVEKKQRGKSLGATGWIVKPFNPEKLIAVVNKVCA